MKLANGLSLPDTMDFVLFQVEYLPLLENLYKTRLDTISPFEYDIRAEVEEMTFDEFCDELKEELAA